MHYEIRRGFDDKRLTKRQRTSGTFTETPVVLGKVLRRGTPPSKVTVEQFNQYKMQLMRLLLSGSIEIYVVDDNKKAVRFDYNTAASMELLEAANAPTSSAGDPAPPQSPALSAGPKSGEEQEEVVTPPSSKPVEEEEPEEEEEPVTEPEEELDEEEKEP